MTTTDAPFTRPVPLWEFLAEGGELEAVLGRPGLFHLAEAAVAIVPKMSAEHREASAAHWRRTAEELLEHGASASCLPRFAGHAYDRDGVQAAIWHHSFEADLHEATEEQVAQFLEGVSSDVLVAVQAEL